MRWMDPFQPNIEALLVGVSKRSVPTRPSILNCAADRRDMAMLGKKQVLRARQVN